MKYFLILSIFLLISSIQYSIDTNSIYYVHAKSGLNLRTLPDLKSPIITNIRFGEKVLVLQNYTNYIYFDGIYGRWVSAAYDSTNGYIFYGYLSVYPAAVDGKNNIHRYFSDSFGIMEYHNIQAERKKDPLEGADISLTKYSNNITIKTSAAYNGFHDEIVFPISRIEEAFLITKESYEDLNNIVLPLKNKTFTVTNQTVNKTYYEAYQIELERVRNIITDLSIKMSIDDATSYYSYKIERNQVHVEVQVVGP